MAKGPKGEYRPLDPIKAAFLTMQIATRQITEDEIRQARKKAKPKRPAKSRRTKS